MALNIKLLRHTHIRSRGRGLLGTTGSIAGIRANWERHLLGLPIRFPLIQLSDKCMSTFYSTAAKGFDPRVSTFISQTSIISFLKECYLGIKETTCVAHRKWIKVDVFA